MYTRVSRKLRAFFLCRKDSKRTACSYRVTAVYESGYRGRGCDRGHLGDRDPTSRIKASNTVSEHQGNLCEPDKTNKILIATSGVVVCSSA